MSETAFETKTVVLLKPVTCGVCGILFGLSETFQRSRIDDHRQFYCPNGHYVNWSGPSPIERERNELKRQVEDKAKLVLHLDQRIDGLERSLAATKGVVTKVKRRAHAGVCAECNRTFSNVARHMKSKHPEASK